MSTAVVIAEDDPLLRSLLVQLITADVELTVAGSGTTDQAVELVERYRPQVLLVDLDIDELRGLRVIELTRELASPPLVLVLSSKESEDAQMIAARHGAHGFLGKSLDIATLPDSVRAIAGGQVWFTRQVMGRIFQEYHSMTKRVRELERPCRGLSEKELAILTLIARGRTNNQIACDMELSQSTVKSHVRMIFRKLDLPNRSQAAVFAVQEGLLDGSWMARTPAQ